VRPVAVSADSPQESAALCKNAGSSFTFLSEPKAEVVRRYDLLHSGIDWADQKNFWRLLPAGSRQSEAGALDNTPEAVEVWAANLQQRFDGRRIAVILEQSRGALVSC